MKKTNPTISYDEFYNLVKPITQFKSLKGNLYSVISIEDSIITFLRESTQKQWKMNLKDVHRAYLEIKDFKTIHFKPYLPRTQSPAFGLLVKIGLVININQ